MAKEEMIIATINREDQRWPSGSGATVILACKRQDDSTTINIKVKEKWSTLVYGQCLAFFGKWGHYMGEPQFLAEMYVRSKHIDDCWELIKLFVGTGLPRDLAATCCHRYPRILPSQVKENPFKALLGIPRCGFKLVDKVWTRLGLPSESIIRQAYGMKYVLTKLGDGSIWAERIPVRQALSEFVHTNLIRFDEAVEYAQEDGLIESISIFSNGSISVLNEGDVELYAEAGLARAERLTAQMYCKGTVFGWPKIEQGEGKTALSDHQYAVVKSCLRNRVSILTGGGGTGKTFVAARIIRQVLRDAGAKVIVCAPTGKAAVRCNEALSECGVDAGAKTIHSILGYRGGDDFTVSQIDADLVVVDETSMVDTPLMSKLMLAAENSLVLLIGDPYQLPPVGAGAPFRDMIDHDETAGELTEILRNSGAIVEAGQYIREGKEFSTYASESEDGNLWHVQCDSPEQVAGNILGQIHLAQHEGYDPIWDVQVIAALNMKEPLSCEKLNQFLQEHLNPNEAIEGTVFRLGDKVINTKNSFLSRAKKRESTGQWKAYPLAADAVTNEAGEIYVANGEMGTIFSIDPGKFMIVRLDNPLRYVNVFMWKTSEYSDEGETGSVWQLGYAITCHKSQGSQFPVCIIAIDESNGARRLVDRSHVYTAVSRAKHRCVLVGNIQTVYRSIRQSSIWRRRTLLKERIKHESRQVAQTVDRHGPETPPESNGESTPERRTGVAPREERGRLQRHRDSEPSGSLPDIA